MTVMDRSALRVTAIYALLGVAWVAASVGLVALSADGVEWFSFLALAVLWLAATAGVLYYVVRLELGREEERESPRAERYRALVERSAEIILVLGQRGRVHYASPNIREVLGHLVDPAVATESILDFIHPEDRRKVLRALVDVRGSDREGISCEFRLRHRDGSYRYFEAWGRDLLNDPEVGGILVTLRDVTPRKRFESEIQQLAFYDPLTGLANRRFFNEHGSQSLALARRRNQPLAVLYVDLDRFKIVNDTLGHDAGDDLLKQVAVALEKSVRETDIVARIGGDEFAVLLSEVRDTTAAGRVATRAVASMPSGISREGHEITVSASVGIAMYPEDGDDLEALLQAADLAMYRAKSERSGLQFYRPELRGLMQQQMRMEADLRRAFEHHEFDLHYQPVHSLVTGDLVGAEALSRWRHLSRGLVQASDFIQLAEQTGLISSLDRWAIGAALQHRRSLLGSDWKGWISVNLAPRTMADPAFIPFVRDALETSDVPPGSLVLEIGEEAAMHDPDATADLLWELKSMGAVIALDDFGLGTSSLTHLKRFPVDILKLGPDFVAGIGTDSPDEHMVRATISIAHGIHAKVLAKGVERDEQAEWLREAGCDFVQGYLVGRPVPPEHLRSSGAENADVAAEG